MSSVQFFYFLLNVYFILHVHSAGAAGHFLLSGIKKHAMRTCPLFSFLEKYVMHPSLESFLWKRSVIIFSPLFFTLMFILFYAFISRAFLLSYSWLSRGKTVLGWFDFFFFLIFVFFFLFFFILFTNHYL